MDYNPIFIGGTGRCGTTVIGNILGSHPDVLYFAEPRLICDSGGILHWVRGGTTYEELEKNLVGQFRDTLCYSTCIEASMDVYSETFISSLAQDVLKPAEDKVAASGEFLDRLFGTMVFYAGKRWWAEKTPHTVMFTDYLYTMFPHMRYIHVIRDPKDVFASMKEQAWGPKTADEFVEYYNAIMRVAYKASKSIPRNNYKVVSLERLATDQVYFKMLMRFLEITINLEWKRKAWDMIDANQVHAGRWKDDLTSSEAEVIIEKCMPYYDQWKERM